MRKKLFLELMMWLVTLLLVVLVLFPIYLKVPDYPFWLSNTVFVVTTITLIRYIFLLKLTWLAHMQKMKVACLLLMIPLVSYLISELNFFQVYLDENDIESFIGHLDQANMLQMDKYIRAEMVFFGTTAIISCFIFQVRMVISVWRKHNAQGI